MEDFSQNLSISQSKCRLALQELQQGALKKLAARKEFQDTGKLFIKFSTFMTLFPQGSSLACLGIATFQVRCVSNKSGDRRLLEIKCSLTALGKELQELIANTLEVESRRVVKCISAGHLVDPEKTLLAQNLRNNQQIMVILGEGTDGTNLSIGESMAMYDRISKIRKDVETIVDSNQGLMEVGRKFSELQEF